MPLAGEGRGEEDFEDIWLLGIFTPLESPSIYAEDGRNRKHQLLIEDEVKALPFLTEFTSLLSLSTP